MPRSKRTSNAQGLREQSRAIKDANVRVCAGRRGRGVSVALFPSPALPRPLLSSRSLSLSAFLLLLLFVITIPS